MKNLVKMMMLATAFIGTSMDIIGMQQQCNTGNMNSQLLSDNLNADNSDAALNLSINVEGTTTENTIPAPNLNKLVNDMYKIHGEFMNNRVHDGRTLMLRSNKDAIILVDVNALQEGMTLEKKRGLWNKSRNVTSVPAYRMLSDIFSDSTGDSYYNVFLSKITIQCEKKSNEYYHLYGTVNENPEIRSYKGCCGCCNIF